MQIDLSIVLSLFTALVTAGAWLYVREVKEREKDTEKKILALHEAVEKTAKDLSGKIQKLDDRISAEEKATIRQDGEMALGKQAHLNLTHTFNELRVRTSGTSVSGAPQPSFRTFPSGKFDRPDPEKEPK